MDGVLIRRAGRADALLVAALTLQAARAEGLEPATGFLDRFAEAWLGAYEFHPAWWAEAEGQHAGILVATWFRPLPWPGRPSGGTLRTERLFVRTDQPGVRLIETALRAAAREWATARSVAEILID